MPKPVEDYYDEKKRRYLEDMRRAGETMTTGTPFDWEEVDAYTTDLPERSEARSADSGATGDVSRSAGWRGWFKRMLSSRRRGLENGESSTSEGR